MGSNFLFDEIEPTVVNSEKFGLFDKLHLKKCYNYTNNLYGEKNATESTIRYK